MRNLKKILALVLAFLMSLSLMVTAGATDFSDDGKVSETYRQAVEVLSELGVFNGDQNGQFNPDQPINRAEVAAILYRIATGDVGTEGYKTYAPYNQFPDVMTDDWYAGYVTYCANAGYIKGRSDGTFDAKANITGYEVLAMILRAVGYDKNNEFVGSNWQMNTASTATQRGVLENILQDGSVRLSEPASREVVAEMLFRASLIDQVNWNAATLSYTQTGESLAKANLGLEEVTGVVMANEYADLEADEPMAAGKTRISVDGVAYTLDIGSELTDIGEIRQVYTVKGEVLFGGLMNPELSNVAESENGAGSKVADVARQGNMKIGSDTEFFINFGDAVDGYVSDVRIEYVTNLSSQTKYDAYQLVYENGGQVWYSYIDEDENLHWITVDATTIRAEGWSVNPDVTYKNVNWGTIEYRKEIKVGEQISAMDMNFIRNVFYTSDSLGGSFDGAGSYGGEIYVYTKSGDDVDYSDDHTYKQFVEEIIGSDYQFETSDNGEWLKVVDNDDDGVADYVFRTDFVMTTVTAYNKQAGTYSTEYVDINGENEIPEDALAYVGNLSGADSLSVGQVILYTAIDGVYYVQEPEVDVVVFDSVDKTHGVCTAGDTEYLWSGINQKAAAYFNALEDAAKDVNYKLYKDAFGYVRLYSEATQFVLLTDGYFYTNVREHQWKAQIWDGALSFVDVFDTQFVSLSQNTGYINPTENADTTQSNRDTWKRLNGFDYYRYGLNGNRSVRDANYAGNGRFYTNIASVVMDGEVYNLYDIQFNNNAHNAYNSYEIISVGSDGVTLTGVDTWGATRSADKTKTVKTNSGTIYYLVTVDTATSEVVDVETPSSMPAAKEYDRAYVISSVVTSNTAVNYETAEIVVCEVDSTTYADLNPYFALAEIENSRPANAQPIQQSIPTRARAASYAELTHIYALGYNETTGNYEVTDIWVDTAEFVAHDLLEWYLPYENGNEDLDGSWIAPADYDDYGIDAGVVSALTGVNDTYVQFSYGTTKYSDTKGEHYKYETAIFGQNDIPVYLIENIQGTVTGYQATTPVSKLAWEDEVIYLSVSGKVVMAINVTQSVKSDKLASADKNRLESKWSVTEQQSTATVTTTAPAKAHTLTFYGVAPEKDTYTITVSYKQASEYAGSAISVTNGNYSVGESKTVALSETTVNYTVTVIDGNNKSFTYNLTQEGKVTNANVALRAEGKTQMESSAAPTDVYKTYGDVTELLIPGNTYLIEDYIESFQTTPVDARVVWTFTTTNGDYTVTSVEGKIITNNLPSTIKDTSFVTAIKAVVYGDGDTVGKTYYNSSYPTAQVKLTSCKAYSDSACTVEVSSDSYVKVGTSLWFVGTGEGAFGSSGLTAKYDAASNKTISSEYKVTSTSNVSVTFTAYPLITLNIAKVMGMQNTEVNGATVEKNGLALSGDSVTFTVTVTVDNYDLVKADGETHNVTITPVEGKANTYTVTVAKGSPAITSDTTINLKLEKVLEPGVDDRYYAQYKAMGIDVVTNGDTTTITVSESALQAYLSKNGRETYKWVLGNGGSNADAAVEWNGVSGVDISNIIFVGVEIPCPDGATGTKVGDVDQSPANGAMHKYYGVYGYIGEEKDIAAGWYPNQATDKEWNLTWEYTAAGTPHSGTQHIILKYVD